jgi:hypothetical protein
MGFLREQENKQYLFLLFLKIIFNYSFMITVIVTMAVGAFHH